MQRSIVPGDTLGGHGPFSTGFSFPVMTSPRISARRPCNYSSRKASTASIQRCTV